MELACVLGFQITQDENVSRTTEITRDIRSAAARTSGRTDRRNCFPPGPSAGPDPARRVASLLSRQQHAASPLQHGLSTGPIHDACSAE